MLMKILDLSEILNKKDVFALTVNGDSMIDACIGSWRYGVDGTD